MAEKFDTEKIIADTNLVELVSRYREVKKNGAEFIARCLSPDHADNNPSMTVSQDKGFVHCFSCQYHENAIGVLMTMENIDFVESCKRLLNGSGTLPPPTPIAQPALKKPPPRITTPPPDGTPPPDMKVKGLGGAPSTTWEYRTPEGKPWGYVARYETKEGKQIRVWSWGSRSPEDPPAWACGHWSTPRPLYGLDRLAKRPTAQLLICEGEKATDAAIKLFPKMLPICWPGGAQAFKYADWSMIKGRDVVLWPDNDEAGIECMGKLAMLLRSIAGEIKGFRVADMPPKWDAADWSADMPEPMVWAKGNLPDGTKRLFTYQNDTPGDEIPTQDPPPHEEIPLEAYSASDAPRTGADTTEAEPTQPTATSPAVAPKKVSWKSLGYQLTDKGTPVMNLNNAAKVLEHDPALKGKIWYDEFLDAICTNWAGPERQWADRDTRYLQLYMQRYMGLSRITPAIANDAANTAAFFDTRNPCRDWIKACKWDGTPRLEYMMSEGFGAIQDTYTAAVGRCWITSVVARVMHPGCKVDTVPVLEGPQGAMKSTALSILGGKWFIECHTEVTSKDFYGTLNGHMLVEIAEMHSFSRSEVDKIKGIISCQIDRYRPAYGHNTQDHPRATVLVCTTNRDDWQRDDTGARRFWPIACGEINLDWITENREQLFGEALEIYERAPKYATARERMDADASWWDVPRDQQEQEVNARRESDSWEAAIGDWIVGKQRTTIGYILDECLSVEVSKQDMPTQRRVGRILRNMGWRNTIVNESGTSRRMWVRPEAPKPRP